MTPTIIERERIAYVAGDTAALSLIYAGEEEFETLVSPDHEAVIDDRNRLRDALGECAARMDDAVIQLDELDISEGSGTYACAPAFLDAIEDAREAIARCESQGGDTPADKLHKLQARYDALQAQCATDRAAERQGREAISTLRYLVSPYVGKPAPKWAAHAQRTLASIDRQSSF